jgi:hypothetical protein
MRNTSIAATIAVALVGCLAGPAVVFAQSSPVPTTSQWDLWAGCWILTDETTDDADSPMARLFGLAARRTGGDAPARVCVTTDSPTTVTMTTSMGDRPVLTETIVADGTQRPLTDDACRGWQRNEWSARGPRLFASAEVTCGNQSPKKVSGLSLMVAGPTWIDIQLIDSDGQKNLRVRRYRRAPDPVGTLGSSARRAAQQALSRRLTVADITEAHGKVAPEALQAALIELKSGFDLKSRQLLELDRAGVSRDVIDLMVALSYPQRFVVDRPVSSGGGVASWGAFDAFDPAWAYYGHPYLWTSLYAPFGYRYWGNYDHYYFNGPGFVTINPGGGTGDGGTIEPSGQGRVVDGYGYTRVRRSDPEPVNGGGWGGGSTSSTQGGSSSGNSGSSGVSSGGYSSGGGGGGERTAQPRPPGGY